MLVPGWYPFGVRCASRWVPAQHAVIYSTNFLRVSVRASSCAPARFPVLKKLFAEWHTEDVRNMTVKSCLLEGHIEQFCLEVLWGHMQASEFTFEVHQLLMSALLLRLQSGAHSRHGNLVEIKWEDRKILSQQLPLKLKASQSRSSLAKSSLDRSTSSQLNFICQM